MRLRALLVGLVAGLLALAGCAQPNSPSDRPPPNAMKVCLDSTGHAKPGWIVWVNRPETSARIDMVIHGQPSQVGHELSLGSWPHTASAKLTQHTDSRVWARLSGTYGIGEYPLKLDGKPTGASLYIRPPEPGSGGGGHVECDS